MTVLIARLRSMRGRFTGLARVRALRAWKCFLPAAFSKTIARLSPRYPLARNWRAPNASHISRVTLTKTDRQGTSVTVPLGGKDFIFDGWDKKLKGWSVAIDKDGYIHIIGGQHNRPDPRAYIPGSWEALGLSRDQKSADYPAQMYWVSKNPGRYKFP